MQAVHAESASLTPDGAYLGAKRIGIASRPSHWPVLLQPRLTPQPTPMHWTTKHAMPSKYRPRHRFETRRNKAAPQASPTVISFQLPAPHTVHTVIAKAAAPLPHPRPRIFHHCRYPPPCMGSFRNVDSLQVLGAALIYIGSARVRFNVTLGNPRRQYRMTLLHREPVPGRLQVVHGHVQGSVLRQRHLQTGFTVYTHESTLFITRPLPPARLR